MPDVTLGRAGPWLPTCPSTEVSTRTYMLPHVGQLDTASCNVGRAAVPWAYARTAVNAFYAFAKCLCRRAALPPSIMLGMAHFHSFAISTLPYQVAAPARTVPHTCLRRRAAAWASTLQAGAQVCARVWDWMMADGSEVLFVVGLALLQLSEVPLALFHRLQGRRLLACASTQAAV